MNIVARRKQELVDAFKGIVAKFTEGDFEGVQVTKDTRSVLFQDDSCAKLPFLGEVSVGELSSESSDSGNNHQIIGNYVHVEHGSELPKNDRGLVLAFQVQAKSLISFVSKLKEIGYTMLLSVTAVDYHEVEEDRFDVVYHLRNMKTYSLLRIVVPTELVVPSLCNLYHSANFMERETYDMYGIKFTDHPDLRRILMYDEFEGYPLRKDYPLQKKQPRIPLLKPEDENTARMMTRPDLITINKKKEQRASE